MNCAEVFTFTALRVEKIVYFNRTIMELKLQIEIIPLISLFLDEYDINVNG